MCTKPLLACLLLCAILNPSHCGVLKKKRAILEAERNKQIGGRITLTTKEFLVNELLLKLKADDYAGYNDAAFLASKKFTAVRAKIEESKLFKYIEKIPKGAAVHTHLFNARTLDFIFGKLARRDDLYVCDGKQLFLRFLPEGHNNTECEWKQYIALLKNNSGYVNHLKSKLIVDAATKTKVAYVNNAIHGLLTHQEMFKEYIKQVLMQYKEDNIQHVQFRGDLFELYETHGNVWNELSSFGILNATLSSREVPSVKFIYVPTREGNYMKRIKTTFHDVYKTFPNIILGLDIHNLDKTEQEHVKEFFAGRPMKFFSEGGKSNWYGLDADTDIVDAFLSGSSRIGHAFSLQIHPELLKMVKENNVAIEICPISDQLHGLVADFRNHPAVNYIANGLSVIIGNDRPSLWGASGLSHDWYVTFMAMTKNDTGLSFFKELALNSIYHSGLDGHEKDGLLRGFYKKWNEYVDEAQAMIEVLKMFG